MAGLAASASCGGRGSWVQGSVVQAGIVGSLGAHAPRDSMGPGAKAAATRWERLTQQAIVENPVRAALTLLVGLAIRVDTERSRRQLRRTFAVWRTVHRQDWSSFRDLDAVPPLYFQDRCRMRGACKTDSLNLDQTEL